MSELAAPCPHHREAQVTFTCARCGTFGCEACRGPRKGLLCARCESRTSTPRLPVLETQWESIRFLLRRPALPLLALVVSTVHAGLSAWLLESQPWWSRGGDLVWDYLFSTLLQVFIIRYVGDQLLAPERPLRDSLRDALRRLPAGLGSSVLVAIAVLLGGLAFLLPGLFLLLVLSLAPVAAVLHGANATDSLVISWRRTRHHRWQLGLLVLLNGPLLAGAILLLGTLQAFLEEWGMEGARLEFVLEGALSGLLLSLMSTVFVFSDRKLSGEWTGEHPAPAP